MKNAKKIKIKVRFPTAKGTIKFEDRKKSSKNIRKVKHKKKFDQNTSS